MRAEWGCRRDNPKAISKYPIKWDDLETDHCPGVEINTPWVDWLLRLAQAQQLGYTLGNWNDASNVEATSLAMLKGIRNRIEMLRLQDSSGG